MLMLNRHRVFIGELPVNEYWPKIELIGTWPQCPAAVVVQGQDLSAPKVNHLTAPSLRSEQDRPPSRRRDMNG
jgi:hypothetical protein